MSTSMSNALKQIVSEIVTKSMPVTATAPKPPIINNKPQQRSAKTKTYINGYEVKWTPHCADSKPIPVIQDKANTFYIQFPTKKEDIDIPVGTVRVTYNKTKACVEYFKAGSNEPIKSIHDQKHEPLPLPKYFSHLEKIEETFHIDMTTGEIVSTVTIDILPEHIHWKIRMQEFEKNQREAGYSTFVINRKVTKYMKSLISLRRLKEVDLNQAIPLEVLAAIETAKKQLQIKTY